MFKKLLKKKEKPKTIFDEISDRHLIIRIIILCLSLFLSAVVFNLLQLPTKIVSGGSAGIAVITESAFGWTPSIVLFIIYASLLVLSLFTLGYESTLGAAIATFVYPLFVDWTSNITSLISIDTSDMLLMAIFIGVLNGFVTGVNYKIGFSSGGTNIISQVLYKWKHWSISKTSLFLNAIIVICGGFCFGWTMVMYSIIVVAINSITMDRVLLGISKSKTFYVITTEEEKVKDYIMNDLGHGVTIFNVHGGFLEKKKHVLMTVVPTADYFKLTAGVKTIDKDAFFVVIDAYESSVQKEILPITEDLVE